MSAWGSVMDHELTVVALPTKRRRCHFCPKPKKAATHVGCANGIGMTAGCEWHMRVWLRDMLARRRAR